MIGTEGPCVLGEVYLCHDCSVRGKDCIIFEMHWLKHGCYQKRERSRAYRFVYANTHSPTCGPFQVFRSLTAWRVTFCCLHLQCIPLFRLCNTIKHGQRHLYFKTLSLDHISAYMNISTFFAPSIFFYPGTIHSSLSLCFG